MWQRFFYSLLDLLYPHACVACQKAGQVICEDCLKTVRPDVVTEVLNGVQVTSIFAYDTPVLSKAVQAWKYEGIHDAITPFLYLYPPVTTKATVIIPVPLHRRKRLERGFNQSELLAKHLSKETGLPMLDGLKRARYTEPQAQQDREGRLNNVKDAFVWKGEDIQGQTILLVDDVVSTGATLKACAEALLSAGAKEVVAWCLARGGSLK
jgi:ComF family protein